MNFKFKLKNFVIVILNVTLMSTLICFPVRASSGQTGSISWKLVNGVLTISGRGSMPDYFGSNDLAPWYDKRQEITSVIIEDGITYVGESAFFECTSLTNVTIANSVKAIGPLAFLKCRKLKDVVLSNKLTEIGHGAFKQCESLKMIYLPNSLKKIDYEAFFDCDSLMSITIPSSVIYLGNSIFTYCDSLIQANIYANITELPTWLFYGCTSLKQVSLSKSVSNIGYDAFENCLKLEIVNNTTNEVLEAIKNQTNDNIRSDEILDSTISNKNEVIDNHDITLGLTTTENETNLDVIIKETNGWEALVDKVDDYLYFQEIAGKDITLNVQVNLDDSSKVPSSIINGLVGKNVVLTLKGESTVIINCSNLTSGKNYSDLKLGYSLEKIETLSKNMINVLGNSEAYTLKFLGSSDFKVTLSVLLGNEYSYQYATIYQREGMGYNYLQNVQIDGDGYANFYFDGFDSFTTYLIGINVSNENALIPDSLHGGLMDEHGNKYEITGVKSKWGISLGTFSLIIFGAVGVIVLIIGGAMFIMFKRQQANEKIRREVMSEGYSKEDDIKKTKITKNKLFNKKITK